MATAILRARLEVPSPLVAESATFYGKHLGMPLSSSDGERVVVEVGESALELQAAPGKPFYHVALLVPGDRFGAALDVGGGARPAAAGARDRRGRLRLRVLGRARLLLPRPGRDDRGADRASRRRRGWVDGAVSRRGATGALRGRHRRRPARRRRRARVTRARGLGRDGGGREEASPSWASRRARSSSAAPDGRGFRPGGRPSPPGSTSSSRADRRARWELAGGSRVSRRGADAAVQAS